MALDTPENREELIGTFHRLADDENFCIMSRKTPSYNCIAWAMGFEDRWVDCFQDSGIAHKKWWPNSVSRDFRPATLVSAFEAVGFVTCDDGVPEDGYDKVALYKVSPLKDPITDEVIAEEGWTHAAKVVGDNLYHSKIGGLFDIHHSGGEVFSDSSYGSIYQFMKRKQSDRSICDNIRKQVPGFSIPDDILNIINEIMSKA